MSSFLLQVCTAAHLPILLFSRAEVYLSEGALIYSLLFGGATLLCLLGAWHARYLPHRDARHGLVVLLLTSGLWAATQLAFVLADTYETAYIAYIVGLVIGFSTVWAWLYFCSAYSGRTLHRRPVVIGGSVLLFGIITMLKLTNPLHGFYFAIQPNEVNLTAFTVDRYLLYWTTTTISYALVVVGFFMLMELWLHVRGRRAAIAGLFGLTLLPVVGNVLGLLVPTVADVYHEPLGVAAFALGVLFIARDQFVAVQEVGTRNEPALILDAGSRLRSYNDTAATLFPALAPHALSQPISAVLPDVANARSALHPIVEVSHHRSRAYYRVAESYMHTGGIPVYLLVLLDVTDRERQFREQEQFVQSITESVSDGIFQISFEDGVVYANPAMANIFGYASPVALQTTPPTDLFADAGSARQLHDTLLSQDTFTGEMTFCKADGSHFVGRVSATLIRNDAGDPVYYNGVLVDITVQKNREQALQIAKEETEAVTRLKDNLLANMSHEVRTPLTAILGFSEVLVSQTDGPTQRFARRIHRGGQRLKRTLEAMLSLSKLRSGTYTPNPDPIHLLSFVADIVAQFQSQAASKDITLALDAPSGFEEGADAPETYLDTEACRHILYHLIDNAVKFTPKGGSVTVQATQHDDSVQFVVEDTGVGITEHVQDAIFESFKQESEGQTRAYEGSGIGLSIVRQFTDLIGGTVTLESAKDEGSRFTVQLPIADLPDKHHASDPPSTSPPE